MSPKNSLLKASLIALGLSGYAPLALGDPPTPTPSGSVDSQAPALSNTVLLLTNGRVLEGTVTEQGTKYLVQTRNGRLPVDQHAVVKLGRSVKELYQHLAERVPDRDPDEHLKLAQWCLNQGLRDEAKDQLQKVVDLSAGHPQALAMLHQIRGAEERESRRDPEVTQANVEVAERPASYSPVNLGRAQRALGISDFAQIPGLSRAQAVKRADHFVKFVDPILQFRCAKCHDERYEGSFQLIHYRQRSDRTTDANRANLDSVLSLIDLENPARSELLSSSLRPHGKGSKPRPIFRGSNDREYQVLAAWVNSLKGSPTMASTTPVPPRLGAVPVDEQQDEEGFARSRRGTDPLPTLTPTPTTPAGRFDEENPFGQPAIEQIQAAVTAGMEEGRQSGPVNHPDMTPDASFPVPFQISGQNANPSPNSNANPNLAPNMQMPASGSTPPLPQGRQVDPATGAPLLQQNQANRLTPPGMVSTGAQPLPQAGTNEDPATPKVQSNGSSKPLKIDPALLEKALRNRYKGPN